MRNRILLFFGVFVLEFLASASMAQMPPHPMPAPSVTLLGAGASTCAKYLADSQSAPAYQAVYSNWALGYLTALNVINSGKPGGRIFSDAAGVDMRLKSFCASNPSKTYSDAVTDLAVQFAR